MHSQSYILYWRAEVENAIECQVFLISSIRYVYFDCPDARCRKQQADFVSYVVGHCTYRNIICGS